MATTTGQVALEGSVWKEDYYKTEMQKADAAMKKAVQAEVGAGNPSTPPLQPLCTPAAPLLHPRCTHAALTLHPRCTPSAPPRSCLSNAQIEPFRRRAIGVWRSRCPCASDTRLTTTIGREARKRGV